MRTWVFCTHKARARGPGLHPNTDPPRGQKSILALYYPPSLNKGSSLGTNLTQYHPERTKNV